MKDLVLLHGALGCKEQMVPLEAALQESYRIHRINFPGHAGEVVEPYGFSIPGFADAVKHYVEKNGLENPSIFGYSMGGYVALYAAAHQLFPIHKIMTLATKFAWSPEIALKETALLDEEKMRAKVPAFASALEERHSPQPLGKHLQLTAQLMHDLGAINLLDAQSFSAIQQPCLLMLGDNDKMVSSEETLAAAGMIPGAQFELLPGTPHPIEKVDIGLLAGYIRDFIGGNKDSKSIKKGPG